MMWPKPVGTPLLCRLGLHRLERFAYEIPTFTVTRGTADVAGRLCMRPRCSHIAESSIMRYVAVRVAP